MSYGERPRPRPRFGSQPDQSVHAPDVYEILERHDQAIAELNGFAREGKLADSQILSKLSNIEATDRHALTKLVIGLATTAIVTIGGVVGGMQAFRAPAAQPVQIQRSALDVKLDVCRPIQDPGSRKECESRVFEEAFR